MTASPPSAESTSADMPNGLLPVALNMDRYEALAKKSPFTAVAAEETAGFAQDLALAGFVRLKGEDFVMVANRATADRFLVGKKESPSARGLVLVEVMKDPQGDATKMKAKVKKGGEVATISFQAASAPPPAGQPVGQVPPGPGQALPGQPAPKIQPPGQKQPTAPVIRRRVIPVPSVPGR